MGAHRLTSSAGFTLVAAMVAVVIIGIMLGAASQTWQTMLKRDREEELLFRGTQYRDAIAQWYKPRPGQPPTQQTRPLKDLKDLLEDPNSLETVRYLRRLYKDPITNGDFEPILGPTQEIIGVKSASQDPPLKRGNFPDDLKDFGEKDKYSDWQFNYRTQLQQQQQQQRQQQQQGQQNKQ
ncbi:MAG TPA: type II secretion system protein [Geobacteraceae bacterium]